MKNILKKSALALAFLLVALGLYFGIAVHGNTFSITTQIATILFGFIAPGLMFALFALALAAGALLWRKGRRKATALLAAFSLIAGFPPPHPVTS